MPARANSRPQASERLVLIPAITKNSTTGYKNVNYDRSRKKFEAKVRKAPRPMWAQESHCHRLEIGDEDTDAMMIIPTLTLWSRFHRIESAHAANGRKNPLQTCAGAASKEGNEEDEGRVC